MFSVQTAFLASGMVGSQARMSLHTSRKRQLTPGSIVYAPLAFEDLNRQRKGLVNASSGLLLHPRRGR